MQFLLSCPAPIHDGTGPAMWSMVLLENCLHASSGQSTADVAGGQLPGFCPAATRATRSTQLGAGATESPWTPRECAPSLPANACVHRFAPFNLTLVGRISIMTWFASARRVAILHGFLDGRCMPRSLDRKPKVERSQQRLTMSRTTIGLISDRHLDGGGVGRSYCRSTIRRG